MKYFVISMFVTLIVIILCGGFTHLLTTEKMLRQYCEAQGANYNKIKGQDFCIDIKKKTVTKINWYK